MTAATCPSRERLRDYLAGKMSDEDSSVLELHLDDCEACEDTANQLEQQPDTFAEFLQNPEEDAAADSVSPAGEFNLGPARELIDQSDSVVDRSSSMATSVGSYDLLSRLGRGGMGTVYLARHRELHKNVAIKLLPKLAANREHVVARFRREMRAAGRLNHPAIVKATDAGEAAGVHFLVMEVAEGMDLARVTRLVSPLSMDDACELIRQTAIGLAYAHQQGVVHRDIKPSNLMLGTDGSVKILDFGLAQLSYWDESTAELTTVGQLMGTLDYMAPEQWAKGNQVDERADIYSLGATFFKLLTGQSPLACEGNLSPLEKLRLLAEHQLRSLAELRPDVPQELVGFISRMMAADATERPASAQAVAEWIDEFARRSKLKPDLKRLVRRAEKCAREEERSSRQSASLPALATQQDGKGAKRNLRGPWMVLATAVGFIAAGIVLTLELTKGQLIIESEGAEVSIQLVDEQQRTDALQIEPGTNTTRLRDGKYAITLDEGSDRFTLNKDTFTIQRGEAVVARVTRNVQEPKEDSESRAPKESVENQRVQNGDTLAIYFDRIIPFYPNPREPLPIPIFQAGNRHPVQGLPFRVNSEGWISLPLVGELSVGNRLLENVPQMIKQKYIDSGIIPGDRQDVVSVDFLLRADESLEVKNLTGGKGDGGEK